MQGKYECMMGEIAEFLNPQPQTALYYFTFFCLFESSLSRIPLLVCIEYLSWVFISNLRDSGNPMYLH
jgi:hypothetical protein